MGVIQKYKIHTGKNESNSCANIILGWIGCPWIAANSQQEFLVWVVHLV